MSDTCTLELHAAGAWHAAASVSLLGPEAEGWRAKTYSGYAVDWAFAHAGAADAHALCARWPVGLEPHQEDHWPVHLIDMLPQGYGRQELLRRIGQPATAGVGADWKLLLAGAGNPIGNLRVKEAACLLAANTGPLRGFTDNEVAHRGDEFAEYLASHGLFVAGSSGVQGEWPKLLLTRADDGLLYLDHSLPDERAAQHYIVKFGRGTDQQLASILRHEAPYMGIARLLGLRVHAPLALRQRALFIPRFDRVAQAGAVTRLAQESIATLTGMPGFEAVPSHDQVCEALIRHSSDPQADILEYIKRDITNLALLNKDNHARNTAVQRSFNGRTTLTPLFDFAPMYLHPDGIARRIRWEGNDNGQPDWARVVERVCELAAQGQRTKKAGQQKRQPAVAREALIAGLKAMEPALRHVAAEGNALGVEPDVLNHIRPHLLARADELAALG
ncbi:MAG: HipA domain-containing protein [Rubrivivax sp.]|jgi:serine/threonine-protein kinase HipA|nr:HipA domain-containing protein [Rubrivivax sp.]